jgi:hypothetical protein
MTKRNNRFFGKELSLEELSYDDLLHVSGGEGGNNPPPHCGGEGQPPCPGGGEG